MSVGVPSRSSDGRAARRATALTVTSPQLAGEDERECDSAKFSAARCVAPCEIITPLGIDVVPEVNSSCQMSSPWISTSGSVTGCPSIRALNDGLPGTGSPPMVMVAPTGRPVPASARSARGHSSASTMAKPGSVSPTRWATTSGARFGLSGTATIPALAMPILARQASTEFSQNSRTRAPGSSPAAASACASRFAVSSASR